jgi:hypothetical protein
MPEDRSPQQGNAEAVQKQQPKKKPTRPAVFRSLKRRDYLILATFWLASACVVGLILIFFALGTSGESQAVYELTPGEITALTLYPLAEAAALAWEEDVLFISASTSWNHASMAVLEQPVEWVYRFYSPGLQRILFVIVTPEQEIIVQPHLRKIRRELQVIDPAEWQMDSPEAITAWLNSGGGRWLQQAPNPVISAQLTFDLDENVPVWTISGLDVETGQSINYTLKATSP